MNGRTRICKLVLWVNGAALAVVITMVCLRADISHGSPFDFPASILAHYLLFVMPPTTIAAIAILSLGTNGDRRGAFFRVSSRLLTTVGLLLLLANYTVLVEGHMVDRFVIDPEGNLVLDESGEPLMELNPSYLRYKKQETLRTICFLGMALTGVSLMFYERRQRRIPPE